MSQRYTRVLTIAGSDSGGGAGIQADLKTFAALGCYGLSAVTVVTVQNTQGVRRIYPVPPEVVADQVRAVLEDMGTDAVKIGMLHSAATVRVAAEVLAEFSVGPIVLDPVLTATSGEPLSEAALVAALKEHLLPLVTLITPNISEAEALTGRSVAGVEDFEEVCQSLADLGCRNVLLKGGHLTGDEVEDWFYQDGGAPQFHKWRNPRINTRNTHGTGCTLSSAIAAYLAQGHLLVAAVEQGRDYLQEALAAGADYRLGQGHGPLHHFYRHWGGETGGAD